ncbi:MAG: pyridoxal phosphate-dependent aminotransferase [Rhodothermales bacterium]|nr:pyridoxal phosphate-dependent aminotransferase [Rhodothermales bacterium]
MSELYHLNQRAATVQPSATLAMTAKASELKRQGLPVIGLSAGEPDFTTPQPIIEAAERALREGWTHYTDNAGLPELRAAIADKLRRDNGLAYEPTQVLLSNGAKQSVAQAVIAVVDDGDEVVIVSPYWVSYPEMVRLAGGVPVAVETTAEDGYVLRPEVLEAAITPKTRLVILNSPSNPTGVVYDRATQEALADVLRRHPHVLVISDEIYEYVVYDAEHVSFATLDGMYDRTITVNGFSKGYAMTGWRLGYLAAPTPLFKICARLQSQLTSAPSTISQKAGVAALAMDRRYVDEMVAAFRERRDFLIGRLSALNGLVLPRPEGAFYLFPDVSNYFGSVSPKGRVIEGADELAYYLLEDAHVALVPGDGFGAPSGIRLSYAASMENLAEAADRIEAALKALA